MTRRTARSLVVGAVTCLWLVGSLTSARAATYGATQGAGAPSSWNPGKALAATNGLLLSAWASDCPPPKGICARNARPKMGVYVQRGPIGSRPATWKRPVRVSQATKQAERASIGADGSLAAVGWVTQTSYLHYRPGARRVFWIRAGSGASWRAPHQLSAPFGRVDYPRIAVSDGRIYAVWTNAGNGDIRLAISATGGRTWTKRTLARSSARADGTRQGFAALPDIGASGANVAVVWFASGSGAVNMVGSTNGGANWSSPMQLTPSSPDIGRNYPAAQGATDDASHRVAIAYGTDEGFDVRTFDGGGLGMARSLVSSWPDVVSGTTFTDGYGPAIAPFGSSGLVAAYAACRAAGGSDPCNTASTGARIDVLVTESSNDGQDWSRPTRLTNAATAPYRINDEPSIVLSGVVRRISFDRYQAHFVNYRVGMRTGS